MINQTSAMPIQPVSESEDQDWSAEFQEWEPGLETDEKFPPNGEDYYVEEGNGVPQEGAYLSVESLRQQITALQNTLSPEQRQQHAQELQNLQGQLNRAQGYLSDSAKNEILQATAGKISAIQAEVFGKVAGEMPVDGEEVEGSLKDQITQFKKDLEANPKLSPEMKDSYFAQLDRWINSLDLNASETTQEQIAENFENLKAEIEQNAMFPNSVNKIAEITGMEASQVEATMRASGLDPEKLPNPPDAKVAEFLNTLESSEGYQAGKEDFNNALRELKTKIAEKMGEASTLNQSNAASDTSILDNTDTSSFKFLWDAKNHQDEYSQKVLDAAKTLTEKRVDILNALYDGDVKADASNPENLGGITFKGTSMNIIDGTSGEAKFSNTQVKWPEIELPKYFVDADDDGAYLGPPWMKDANYPTYVYDPD